jgi:hypothetical protein
MARRDPADLDPIGAPAAVATASAHRRRIARRVADAHAARFGTVGLLALVSGSVVDELADERSDVDMSVVFDGALPVEAELQSAAVDAGGRPWHWQSGPIDEPDGGVVAFELDGIEVQIGYTTHDALRRDVDRVLRAHDPDTPLHKLAEGLLKAEPLVDANDDLAALQARLASFPPALGRAMAAHWLGRMTPWRAIAQIVHRDATLWSRELQVQAAHRLLGALAGLNGLYFTTFQLKRQHRLIAKMGTRPDDLEGRLDRVVSVAPSDGFAELHALEAEVLALVEARWPELDLAAVRHRHSTFVPPAVGAPTR